MGRLTASPSPERTGPGQPRVLVGTLYSGEQEFERCLESLRKQTCSSVEHVVFRNLPNREAHHTLYRTFMKRGDEFEVFVKLDADMVFSHPGALQTIVDQFRADPTLDHLVVGVRDWASASLVMGLHAFSDRVVWEAKDEELFVDPDPRVPGRRVRIPHPETPPALHAPDPSPYQAFRLGVHRALKVVQRNRYGYRYYRALDQWELLGRIWTQFERTGDRRRGLAIAGADLVLRGELSAPAYGQRGDTLERSFSDGWSGRGAEELRNDLWGRWGHPIRREAALAGAIGYPTYWLLGLRRLKRRVLGSHGDE